MSKIVYGIFVWIWKRIFIFCWFFVILFSLKLKERQLVHFFFTHICILKQEHLSHPYHAHTFKVLRTENCNFFLFFFTQKHIPKQVKHMKLNKEHKQINQIFASFHTFNKTKTWNMNLLTFKSKERKNKKKKNNVINIKYKNKNKNKISATRERTYLLKKILISDNSKVCVLFYFFLLFLSFFYLYYC